MTVPGGTSHQISDKTPHVYILIKNMGLGCGLDNGNYYGLTGAGSRDAMTPSPRV